MSTHATLRSCTQSYRSFAVAVTLISALTVDSAGPSGAAAQLIDPIRPIHVEALTAGAGCVQPETLDGPVWEAALGALADPGNPMWKAPIRALEDSLGRASRAAPSDLELQYLYAVLLGARTEIEGGKSQLRKATELHHQLNRVLELDPDHPGAQHIMGRLNAAAMRLGGFKRFVAKTFLGGGMLSSASWEQARTFLEAAERGAPCIPDHHFELAKLYVERGAVEQAREEVDHVLFLVARYSRWRATADKAAALLGEIGPARAEPGAG